MEERKFTFWYKKVVKAQTLERALKLEKKQKPVLSSVEHVDEKLEELTPLIGFHIESE